MESGSNPIQDIIDKQGFMVLDGGFATECEKLGAKIDDDLWSAKLLYESPDIIEKVHYNFFESGADVAITSTYQASFDGFLKKGFSNEQAIELFQKSIQIAENARDKFMQNNQDQKRVKPIVAASLGCFGAFLADGSEYTGNYGKDKDFLKNWHSQRLSVLSKTSADVFACETIPCLIEAQALLELFASQNFQDKRGWLSFSCKDGEHLNSGEDFKQVFEIAKGSEQIVAIGVNCSAPQYIESLLNIAKSSGWQGQILVYANKGKQWDAEKKEFIEGSGIQSDLEYAQMAAGWQKNGASMIGGCCQVGPEAIAAIRQHLEASVEK